MAEGRQVMTDIAPGLLPEGLHDRLPPEAESAATLLRAVMDATAAHGYERVQPPLAEFEASLVGRLKSTRQQDLLRFVVPVFDRKSVGFGKSGSFRVDHG